MHLVTSKGHRDAFSAPVFGEYSRGKLFAPGDDLVWELERKEVESLMTSCVNFVDLAI